MNFRKWLSHKLGLDKPSIEESLFIAVMTVSENMRRSGEEGAETEK